MGRPGLRLGSISVKYDRDSKKTLILVDTAKTYFHSRCHIVGLMIVESDIEFEFCLERKTLPCFAVKIDCLVGCSSSLPQLSVKYNFIHHSLFLAVKNSLISIHKLQVYTSIEKQGCSEMTFGY